MTNKSTCWLEIDLFPKSRYILKSFFVSTALVETQHEQITVSERLVAGSRPKVHFPSVAETVYRGWISDNRHAACLSSAADRNGDEIMMRGSLPSRAWLLRTWLLSSAKRDGLPKTDSLLS